MEFFPQKSGVPVVVRMLSFISREVGMQDESLDGKVLNGYLHKSTSWREDYSAFQ